MKSLEDSLVQSLLQWLHTLGDSPDQTAPPAEKESDLWRVSKALTAPEETGSGKFCIQINFVKEYMLHYL